MLFGLFWGEGGIESALSHYFLVSLLLHPIIIANQKASIGIYSGHDYCFVYLLAVPSLHVLSSFNFITLCACTRGKIGRAHV